MRCLETSIRKPGLSWFTVGSIRSVVESSRVDDSTAVMEVAIRIALVCNGARRTNAHSVRLTFACSWIRRR